MVNDKLIVRKLPGFIEFNKHLLHLKYQCAPPTDLFPERSGVGIFGIKMLLRREASYRSYSYGDDAGSLLGTSDMKKTCQAGGHLDHLPMALGSLQLQAIRGRILYRIRFYFTWHLVCDLHQYVSMCKRPKPKLQLRSASCCLKPQWNMVELVAV